MELIERDFMRSSHQSKRLTACVVGSGTSPFPFQLYSKGWFQEVSCIEKEDTLTKLKEQHGEQRGLHRLSTDITHKEATNEASRKPFDLIVDKGTLDILLSASDGYERAATALRWMWAQTKTPATVILVSHSPPHERIDFLLSEFWNDIKVKYVTQPSLEEVIKSPSESSKPSIQDYPYSIARWEEELELRERGKIASSAEPNHHTPQRPILPSGVVVDFIPSCSFIYILTK